MKIASGRRLAAWGAASLSVVGVLVLSASAALSAGTATGGTADVVAGHRVVRPKVAAAPAGHRVVQRPAAKATGNLKAAVVAAGDTSFSYQSQAGDYIGQGGSGSYKAAEVSITGTTTSLRLSVNGANGDWWYVDLDAGVGDTLRPGVFSGAERDAFKSGRSPGLDAFGQGRGCNEVYGNFTVNQIGFDASGALNLADVTFNQRCETSTAPIFSGTIHLNQFPLSYKQASDAGDYVGGGVTKTYLNSTSLLNVSGSATGAQFSVSGLRDDWTGLLGAPTGQNLTAGKTYAANRSGDATHARLDVFGDGRGCNATTGTLSIQAITVTNGQITKLRAVFEQHCEGGTPALRGTLRYFA